MEAMKLAALRLRNIVFAVGSVFLWPSHSSACALRFAPCLPPHSSRLMLLELVARRASRCPPTRIRAQLAVARARLGRLRAGRTAPGARQRRDRALIRADQAAYAFRGGAGRSFHALVESVAEQGAGGARAHACPCARGSVSLLIEDEPKVLTDPAASSRSGSMQAFPPPRLTEALTNMQTQVEQRLASWAHYTVPRRP